MGVGVEDGGVGILGPKKTKKKKNGWGYLEKEPRVLVEEI